MPQSFRAVISESYFWRPSSFRRWPAPRRFLCKSNWRAIQAGQDGVGFERAAVVEAAPF